MTSIWDIFDWWFRISLIRFVKNWTILVISQPFLVCSLYDVVLISTPLSTPLKHSMSQECHKSVTGDALWKGAFQLPDPPSVRPSDSPQVSPQLTSSFFVLEWQFVWLSAIQLNGNIGNLQSKLHLIPLQMFQEQKHEEKSNPSNLSKRVSGVTSLCISWDLLGVSKCLVTWNVSGWSPKPWRFRWALGPVCPWARRRHETMTVTTSYDQLRPATTVYGEHEGQNLGETEQTSASLWG